MTALPPQSWAASPDSITEHFDHDPDRARELLDEAGWTVGTDGTREKDGERLSFTMLLQSGNITEEQYAVAIQEFWAQIGVEAEIQLVQPATFRDLVFESYDFEVFLRAQTWNASPARSLLYQCDQFLNASGFCSAEVDELMAAGAEELDQESRVALYTTFQNLVLDEHPIGYLYWAQPIDALSQRVHNVFPSSIFYSEPFNAETWWIEH